MANTANRSFTVILAALACALVVAFGMALPTQARASELAATGIGAASGSKAGQGTLSTQKAKVYKIRTAAQWHNISKYKGGTFKVMKNIKLPNESYYLNIRKSKKYTIDLNGHTVKTAYTGVPLRTVAPLNVAGGTVVMKNSKKKGLFYSTETAAVVLQGYGKFYLKGATIVNNATEFRSDITSGIMAYGKSKCYVQGKSKIQSIGNGIAVFEKAKLYVTGNPWVRAGANNYTGQFMHYGSAISVASKTARAYVKGGSFGTKASPDIVYNNGVTSMRYTQSGNYPILDQFGFAIGSMIPKGYKVVDKTGKKLTAYQTGMMDYYNGVTAPSMAGFLKNLGYKSPEYYQVFTTDVNGYYTVYVKKK